MTAKCVLHSSSFASQEVGGAWWFGGLNFSGGSSSCRQEILVTGWFTQSLFNCEQCWWLVDERNSGDKSRHLRLYSLTPDIRLVQFYHSISNHQPTNEFVNINCAVHPKQNVTFSLNFIPFYFSGKSSESKAYGDNFSLRIAWWHISSISWQLNSNCNPVVNSNSNTLESGQENYEIVWLVIWNCRVQRF